MTLAHLLYIPLVLAIGIYIGRQLEQNAARSRRKKRQRLSEIRNKRRQKQAPPQTSD